MKCNSENIEAKSGVSIESKLNPIESKLNPIESKLNPSSILKNILNFFILEKDFKVDVLIILNPFLNFSNIQTTPYT